MNGGVFRTDTLKNMLVFLVVKAAERVPAEDIQPNGFAYLVLRVVQAESRRPPYLPPTRQVNILRKPRREDALASPLSWLPR